MHIALDYDDTYTLDPVFWDMHITSARLRGHTVSIVTYRDDRYDWNADLRRLQSDGVAIYFTRGVAKKWWCEQFGPEKIDVWTDDRPMSLFENSRYSRPELAEWRAQQAVSKAERAA